jgi:hypothetical protein
MATKKRRGDSEQFYLNSIKVNNYNTERRNLKRAVINRRGDTDNAVLVESTVLTILDDGNLRLHKNSRFSKIRPIIVHDFDIHVNAQIAVADAKIANLQNNFFHRLPPGSTTITVTRTGGMPSQSPIYRIMRTCVGEYNQSLTLMYLVLKSPIPQCSAFTFM